MLSVHVNLARYVSNKGGNCYDQRIRNSRIAQPQTLFHNILDKGDTLKTQLNTKFVEEKDVALHSGESIHRTHSTEP